MRIPLTDVPNSPSRREKACDIQLIFAGFNCLLDTQEHTHTHTQKPTHTCSVFLSEGNSCQTFLVSVPSSVIRQRFQSVRFRKICVIPKKLGLPTTAWSHRWHGSTMPGPHITSPLSTVQWLAPGASARQPGRLRLPPGRVGGLHRRHVTHLRRLSPE